MGIYCYTICRKAFEHNATAMLLFKQRRQGDWLFFKQTPGGGWYNGGQCPWLKGCPKNEQLAEKRSLEDNCEILRTIFQPRELSSDIRASRKTFLFFFFFLPNPQINFSRRTHLDRSYIFCGFFRVSLCGFVNQLFNFSVIGFYRKSSFVFPDRLKV